MGRIGAGLVEHEEETQAQNKAVFGLLSCMMIYPATFWALWAMLWYTGTGALVAAFTVWAFAYYHNSLINDIYMNLKRVIAAWRVLVGVWAPRRWELSLSALSQYTTPLVPPENPWIDKNRANSSAPGGTLRSLPTQFTDEPPVKIARRRRPSSRIIMKHLLRARGEAVKALAEFLTTLEASGDGKNVIASIHLAKRFGWVEENTPASSTDDGKDGDASPDAKGYRRAREVIAFLRARGAKIATLDRKIEGDWALSSDEEGTAGESEKDEEDLVWVPSSTGLKQEDD